MEQAVVIIGHGSRVAESNQNFESLIASYQERHPDKLVSHGYLELAEPRMFDALRAAAEQCQNILVLPMQLFHAGHVKNDIPMCVQDVRKEFPGKKFTIADALGVHPVMAELAYLRATETVFYPTNNEEKITVLIVGRGSSDPGSNSDFFKISRLFKEGHKIKWVSSSFIALADPSFDDALESIAKTRPEKLLIVPYFLLTGILIERINEKVEKFKKLYSWLNVEVAAPLGPHEKLFVVLDDRLNQALKGKHELPCDACKYRVEMPGHEKEVGGMNALLMSRRHQYVHDNQSHDEKAHKHTPIKKHVLVCGNVNCVDNGSIRTLAKLREIVKDEKKFKEIIVTKTHCLGHCGQGPTVVVYPDGIWYKGIKEDNVEELFGTHLMNDKPLTEKIETIM